MTSVFVVGQGLTDTVGSSNLFSTIEKARGFLKRLADARRNRLGVIIQDDCEDRFSFYLGWEEHYICFEITEIPIDEE